MTGLFEEVVGFYREKGTCGPSGVCDERFRSRVYTGRDSNI